MSFVSELSESEQTQLSDLRNVLQEKSQQMLGFPINSRPVVGKDLAPFLDFVLNNLGNPTCNATYKVNSFSFEREVISFFAELYQQEGISGYVTNCGSEGNLQGLFLGRQKYPDGIIYHSDASHYSVTKACKVLGGKNVIVKTDEIERLNYDHFKREIIKNTPAIINLNIGTTMSGAIDDSVKIIEMLQAVNVKNYYIHCDAALFGLMLPFLKKASIFQEADSISISGHKFLGCPIPCGVFLSKNASKPEFIEYINATNETLFGSRNGLAVLSMWCTIKKYGKKGLENAVKHCMEMTEYSLKRLKDMQHPCWLHPFSNHIMIAKPSPQCIEKWQLASKNNWSHIILMPHTTKAMLNEFFTDLANQ